MIQVEELKPDEVLGISHILSKHYTSLSHSSKRKKKKRKIPKITTTIKTFGTMISEMVQAKYIADCADHLGKTKLFFLSPIFKKTKKLKLFFVFFCFQLERGLKLFRIFCNNNFS